MKVIQYIFAGFKNRRLITTIYFIQFVLAVTVGLQVYQVMEASIGNSVSLQGLKLGNAHMVINDLLNVHGASLSPLLGQVRWLIVVYLIIAAFIHAGIWYCLIHEEGKNAFWIGGSTYFAKSLVIGLVNMILFILTTALIWIPYLASFQKWMELWPSEAPLLWIGIAVFILWSLVAVFFFVASSFSKIFLIRDGKSVFRSIFNGLKLSVRKVFFLFPILMIFLLVFLALYLGHSVVDDWTIWSSTLGVLVLFVIQQLIVWMKLGLRVSVYNFLLESTS